MQVEVQDKPLVDALAGTPGIGSHHQQTAGCSQRPVPGVCSGDGPEMEIQS